MQIKNRLSNSSTAHITDLMNTMPDASIKVPRNPMKYVSIDIEFQILFNCDSCDEIIVGENKCDQCNRSFENKIETKKFYGLHSTGTTS